MSDAGGEGVERSDEFEYDCNDREKKTESIKDGGVDKIMQREIEGRFSLWSTCFKTSQDSHPITLEMSSTMEMENIQTKVKSNQPEEGISISL